MANKKGNKKAEIEYVEDLVPEKKGNVKKAAKNSLSNNKETKKNKNALPIKITAISLAAITLVFIVLSVIVAVSVSTKQIDYIETDLSKYVTLSKSDYIDFPAEITVPQPSEEIHVNNEIAKLLYSYRIPVDGDQAYKRNITISAGDKVSLYYRGYYLNDEGKRVYFDGGCNFNSESSKLEIGSSTTIPGFESGLIGKNQKDYATFDKLTEGNVEKGDIIYITYSATRGDGTEEKSKKAMVDLSDPDLDEKWGVGFKKYWEENTVKLGEKVEKIVVESIKDGAKQDLYLDITPVEAYRIDNSEKEILEVNAMFPANYSNNPDLSGKSVKFEMFIIAAIDYTVPEFDEKFITEKLEVKAEDLADYEGDDIVAKYKNKILTDLTEEYEQAVEDSVSAIFWEYIVKTAKFKSLPQGDVNTYYKNIVAQIESAHTNYEDTYPTLDSFARAYLGLYDSNADWQAEARSRAETSVKQKLAFYYILKEEGFLPTAEESAALKAKLYDEEVQYYLEQEGVTEESDNYEEMLKDIRDYVNTVYNDDYWNDQVIYEYGLEKICTLAKITNKSK